ncbi:hypothetical protein J4218_04675 [Candidatus Pacearchaeota archaeon]|nr:hypothetical protein [Candidatus Pacearchaeota archaeon]
MKNERHNNNIIFFIILVFILLSIFSLINLIMSETPSTSTSTSSSTPNEAEKKAYEYGLNIDEFLKEQPIVQEKVLKDNPEAFIKGYKEAIAKNPKTRDKFLDSFIKKDDKGVNLIGDEAKNKFWKVLGKDEQEKSFQIIATKLFDKKYPEGTFKDRSKVGIQKIKISDNKEAADKLIWSGNKFGVADKDGKLKTWVDLDNLPRWLSEVEFTDTGEIKSLFNTGYGKVNVVLKGGTVGDAFGELIGPDGKRVGTRMNEGLKSIIYDDKNKQFLVKYDFRDNSGKTVEKTLKLNEKDLPQATREMLTSALNNPTYGDKLKSVLSQFDGTDIGSLGKNGGGVATQKMISVLYGTDEQKTGTVTVDYDEKGNPKIELSSGADLVTIDSSGKVMNAYKQWYSLNGVANSGLDSREYVEEHNKNQPGAKINDEVATLSFNANGEIIAGQNAKVYVDDMGSAFLARDEMIGVSIVKNSFIDAIVRGDRVAVTEAVLQKGEGIIDSLIDIDSLKTKTLEEIKSSMNLEKVSAQLIDILKSELENPDLGIEYKSQLQKAIAAVTSNLEKSSGSIADYLLFRKSSGFTADELRLREEVARISSENLNGIMRTLLSDSEKLKQVVTGDYKVTEDLLKDYLKKVISGDDFRTFADNDNIRDVKDKLNAAIEARNKLGGTSQKPIPEFNSEEINKMIDQFNFRAKIQESIAKGGSAVDYREGLRTALLGEGWLGKIQNIPEEQKKGIANAIIAMVSNVEGKISEEKTKFEQGVLSDMQAGNILKGLKAERFVQQNGNGIVIDTYLNTIHAYGNKRITFDAQVPLREFIATSTKSENDDSGNIIELRNLGQTIMTFDGKKTNVLTNPPVGSFVNIGKIVNSNDENPMNYFRLDSSKYFGYTLYNPEKTSSYQYELTAGLIKHNPFVRSTVTKPIDSDIGANPNSKITITDASDDITGLFGGRLKKKFINPKLPKGFPTGILGEKAGPLIDKMSSWMDEVIGKENIQNGVKVSDKMFDFMTESGVTPPLILGDVKFIAQYPESMKAIFDFMSKSSNQPKNNNVEITPQYISINGVRATQFVNRNGETMSLEPALRMFMRGYDLILNSNYNPFKHYGLPDLKKLKELQKTMGQ